MKARPIARIDRRRRHSPSLPPFLSPFPPSTPLPLFLPPLEVGPLKSSWESAVSSPSEVWGGAPAQIEFGAF